MDPPAWRLCGRFILLGTLKLRTESPRCQKDRLSLIAGFGVR